MSDRGYFLNPITCPPGPCTTQYRQAVSALAAACSHLILDSKNSRAASSCDDPIARDSDGCSETDPQSQSGE